MKEKKSNLEERALKSLSNIRGWMGNNSRIIIFGAIGLGVAQWAGYINLGVPQWWPLIVGIIASAGGAAYIGADKVSELIPAEDGIWLIAFTTDDGKGGEIWEIHEEDWKEMEVEGTLFEWSESPRQIYECRDYDPETNTAVANWRESDPASELASERTASDAMAAVKDLRRVLEPEAAKAKELRRRIRGITRQLDRQRAAEMNTAIDESTIDKDMGEATVSNVLDEALPDDLHPHAGGGKSEKKNGHNDSWKDEPMVEIDEIDLTDPLNNEQE